MTKKTIKLIILLFGVAFIFGADYAQAQSSPDAIAIRVIPNPEHFSASVWYREQNFTGSPQSIIVDGYVAVRDGRTLYVNVGNAEGGNLYTNIYLISYNQEAETVTRDIFGQILSHWKFNTNLVVTGFCRSNPSVRCLKDEECPVSDFCDSAKARVIRDTRRLSDLADMQVTLNQFNLDNGYFPSLSAGSYLPHRSLSAWPSWDDALRNELGTSMFLDPANKLGACPGYSEDTCWDEVNKSFPTTLPNLPTNSLAYIYLSDPGGNTGSVCGVFESGYTLSGVPICAVDVCLDFDDDGYGNPGSALCSGGVAIDCNDTDPSVQFGTSENCSNFFDDDCDSFVDCYDSDCFGSAACTGFLCVSNGCGGGCPSFCTATEDPDCPPCTSGNGCCDEGCSFAQDSDCPPTCVANDCGGGCPPGCTVAEDPDCACDTLANGCCPAGCDITNDPDCPEICTDADSDGYNAYDILLCQSGNDCNDNNSDIFTGAFESCDGLDNDCDNEIDDGWSDETCDQRCRASGYDWSGNGGLRLNCCGNDPNEGNPDASQMPAFENVPVDRCDDNYDNDCDGLVDIQDSDCSTVCSGLNERDIFVLGEGDCDQCNHNGDDDGNQTAPVFPTVDADWVGYENMIDVCDPACGVSASLIHWSIFEPINETQCDTLDNDCDGSIDEGLMNTFYLDEDGDGFGTSASTTQACPGSTPVGYSINSLDCNDNDSSIHPGAPTICGNGIDEDCDGSDEICPPPCTDVDGDGYGVCPACGTANSCANDGDDCNDSLAFVNPGAAENCDGYDNNCNSQIDEGCDDDADGWCDDNIAYFDNFTAGPLTPADDPCSNTTADASNRLDCLDDPANIYATTTNPGIAVDNCNNNNDDCDTLIDEDETLETCIYLCEPTYGWAGNGDPLNCCGNHANEANPYQAAENGPPDQCLDGNDNDCDGDIDCDDSDCDSSPLCVNTCTLTFDFPCEL